jgi:hypothetical protein
MRPVVGEEREGNAAQLIGPRLQARDRIGADLQNLDVQLLEFLVVRTEPTDLVLSPAGEGERQKRNDGGTPAKALKRDFLVGVVRGEREIRRRRTCLQCHRFLLVGYNEEYRAGGPLLNRRNLFDR